MTVTVSRRLRRKANQRVLDRHSFVPFAPSVEARILSMNRLRGRAVQRASHDSKEVWGVLFCSTIRLVWLTGYFGRWLKIGPEKPRPIHMRRSLDSRVNLITTIASAYVSVPHTRARVEPGC
jgi:hypothetical protein